MKINNLFAAALLFGTAAFGQDITAAERAQALRYLDQTRTGVVEAVKSLSDSQMRFKPAPDRWSVAEVLEHIAVTEEFFLQSVTPDLQGPHTSAAKADAKNVDAMILERVPNRSVKAQAPPPLVPSGRWTPQATLEHFLAAREQTVMFLRSSTDLRQHVVAHPALGPLDGYEWVLAIAAHSERHTKQIQEVKADANFPMK